MLLNHTFFCPIGLDVEHAKFAIKELAKYHALGIICKKNEPDFFEKAKVTLSEPIFTGDSSGTEAIDKYLKSIIFSNPKISDFCYRIEKFFEDHCISSKLENTAEGPWSSILHGDFWVNNIMYHHDENKKIDDVKLIDFQMADFDSVYKDLTYFLFGSCSTDVLNNNFDEVVWEYYNNFINVLEKNGNDLTNYSKDKFDEQLEYHAKRDILRIIFVTKIFMHNVKPDSKVNNILEDVIMAEASDLFKEKTYEIFKKYVEKAWL